MKPSKDKAETHAVLIMDRSPAGQRLANGLAKGWAPVKGDYPVGGHRATRSGRAGSISAKGIDSLLKDTLPTLFEKFLMPPAVPGFGVAAKEATRIWTEIGRLKIAASIAPKQRH